MTIELWTLAIALVTACACGLAGVFLVVKREAMISEGLSHAVLPGILVGFLILGDRSSPLLIVAAALSGLVMVLLVQAIRRTGIVDSDASLGIVFPALFSIGIILASQHLRNTHFHAHCIIDGNLALAPMNRWVLAGVDFGPKAFVLMAAVLLLTAVCVAVFYKELKLMVFDGGLARSFGFRPGLLHVLWLGLVSLTTVAAFETAGSILVVALTITPAAAASLLTNRLHTMIAWSMGIGATSAVAGFFLAKLLDISPTGPMASITGALFLVTLALAPGQGILARHRRRRQQRLQLEEVLLLRRVQDDSAATPERIATRLGWDAPRFATALAAAQAAGDVTRRGSTLALTPAGAERAATAFESRSIL